MNGTMEQPMAARVARLERGARVALVAPAGPVTEERIAAATSHCEELGLEPVPGRAIRHRLGYLAGSDDARCADLQAAIDDATVDAIWAVRGGYGTMRIVHRIDWRGLRERPRPVLGFSDNTALHLSLAALGVVSFHAPHPGAALPDFTRSCLVSQLFDGRTGKLPIPARAPAPFALCGGHATGRLLGGNLSMLAAACGTPFALRGHGCIVLLEDVGEPTYRIDRAATQLLRSGAFEGVAAFAIGAFTERVPNENDRPIEEVLHELLAPLGVPILGGLPFGHIDEQWTLPLGVRARLDAAEGSLDLLDAGVV